jgi:hypothetical protein
VRLSDQVFRKVAPCRLIEVDRHFRRIWCTFASAVGNTIAYVIRLSWWWRQQAPLIHSD